MGGVTVSHCEQRGIIVTISLPHLPTTFANFEKSLYLLIDMSIIHDAHITVIIFVKSCVSVYFLYALKVITIKKWREKKNTPHTS